MRYQRILSVALALFIAVTGDLVAGPFDQFKSMFGGRLGNQGEKGGNTQSIDLTSIIESAKSAKDAFGDVDPKEERAIGVESSSVLLGAAPLLQDAKVQYYVNRVGYWVAQQTERPDLEWRFAVLDVDDINSFAAPGGFVFVTKGLLLQLDNEAELAPVLAHECAHVVQRHYLAAVKKNARLDLSANLVSAAVKTDHKDTLNKVLAGSRELYARGLDKDDEYETDRMGAVLSARAGYEPFGLHHVMQRLATVNPDDGSLSFMFKTHPSPGQRLDELEVTVDPLADYAEGPFLRERYQAETSAIHRHWMDR